MTLNIHTGNLFVATFIALVVLVSLYYFLGTPENSKAFRRKSGGIWLLLNTENTNSNRSQQDWKKVPEYDGSGTYDGHSVIQVENYTNDKNG